MASATLTSKGQVTLPKSVRDRNDGADGTRTRDPRRDRPVRMSASMSGEERAPHESGSYRFSLAFARPRFPRDRVGLSIFEIDRHGTAK